MTSSTCGARSELAEPLQSSLLVGSLHRSDCLDEQRRRSLTRSQNEPHEVTVLAGARRDGGIDVRATLIGQDKSGTTSPDPDGGFSGDARSVKELPPRRP